MNMYYLHSLPVAPALSLLLMFGLGLDIPVPAAEETL
jgi:hypothetical protein